MPEVVRSKNVERVNGPSAFVIGERFNRIEYRLGEVESLLKRRTYSYKYGQLAAYKEIAEFLSHKGYVELANKIRSGSLK